MADVDFTGYLAARKEQQGQPVTVSVGDRELSFYPRRMAGPLLDIAATDDTAGDFTTEVVSRFYRDSLSKEDYAYVRALGEDVTSGFDQPAFFALYSQVIEASTGRPTRPSSPAAESQPAGGEA